MIWHLQIKQELIYDCTMDIYNTLRKHYVMLHNKK
jgi:hypothetical protein